MQNYNLNPIKPSKFEKYPNLAGPDKSNSQRSLFTYSCMFYIILLTCFQGTK